MYFIFELSGIDHCGSLVVDTNVDFGLGFGSHIILAVFVWVVGLVCTSLLILKSLDFVINIKLVPSSVVVLDSGGISDKINSLLGWFRVLVEFLLGVLSFLLLDLLFELFLDFLFFCALLFENFIFGLLLELHFVLPVIQVGNIRSDLLCVALYLVLDLEAHLKRVY